MSLGKAWQTQGSKSISPSTRLASWLSEHEGVTHGIRTTQRNPTTKLAVPTGR
jgi:hypothetical protein